MALNSARHTFMNPSSQSMSEDASKFSERERERWNYVYFVKTEVWRRKYFRIIRFASDCRFIWQSWLQSDLENCNKTSTLTSKLRFVAENGCFPSLLHLSLIMFGSKDFSLKMFFWLNCYLIYEMYFSFVGFVFLPLWDSRLPST